jgi:cobalt/nickel transport system ATP-binding protein
VDSLTLKGVGYSYPESPPALKDVNLSIAPGEKVALVGPNGAGKSTLLHLMSGLFLPGGGEVIVNGIKLTKKDAPQVRRQVGFLFQDPDDQIFMPSVWEDVAFGPINMRLPEEEVRARVAKAMADCGISEFGDRVPHRLSLGEKKRVAMAGILAMDPGILLLDEPTANLDPQGRRDLVRVLQACQQTLVLATHDLTTAFELTQRVIVLKKTVIFDGTFRELLQREDVLREASLELPSFARLMQAWKKETGREFEAPLTVEEALQVLLKQGNGR